MGVRSLVTEPEPLFLGFATLCKSQVTLLWTYIIAAFVVLSESSLCIKTLLKVLQKTQINLHFTFDAMVLNFDGFYVKRF